MNLLIFGEDPAGCAIDKAGVTSLFKAVKFLAVQDYFMTETAARADLILPASLPPETGGSFTNSQKVIQQFGAELTSKVEMNNLQQLCGLLHEFGFNSTADPAELFMEAVSLFPGRKSDKKLFLRITGKDNQHRRFNYGCDAIMKRFEEEFEGKLANSE
jgi:formate dehydrogenase major subunit